MSAERSVTIHGEATRKRSKVFTLAALGALGFSCLAFGGGLLDTGVGLFVVAFVCALAARALKWWDHA